MNLTLSLLLLAGTVPVEGEETNRFDNYTFAYQAAQEAERPMLIVLNPPQGSDTKAVLIDEVRERTDRGELLDDYIVVEIDTGTRHGQVCHELFGSPELPHVVVVDKFQDRVLYKTSRALGGELWTRLLAAYRNGVRPNPIRPASQQQTVQPQNGAQPQQATGAFQPGFRPATGFGMPMGGFPGMGFGGMPAAFCPT
jgi:hypothetical protein